MKIVEGKTAFITGGGAGIGLGMARSFLAAGMNVVIADLRQPALDRAMADLAPFADRVRSVCLDVTDRPAMEAAAAMVQRKFGAVHLLCNNAGIRGTSPLDRIGYAEWDWYLNVNLTGLMNGIIAFLPGLRAHGQGGHIVNTASMGGILPLPAPGGVYTTVKFAIRGLTESLRLTLADQGIGVSLLCPGLVRSDLLTAVDAVMPGAVRETIAQQAPVFDKAMGGQFTPENSGMDPAEVGDRVLAGIRANAPYILTHGEFYDEMREQFDALLAAVPRDEPAGEGRLFFENARREATRAARAAADAIE